MCRLSQRNKKVSKPRAKAPPDSVCRLHDIPHASQLLRHARQQPAATAQAFQSRAAPGRELCCRGQLIALSQNFFQLFRTCLQALRSMWFLPQTMHPNTSRRADLSKSSPETGSINAGGRGGNAGCTTRCCCTEPWAAMCGFSTRRRG